MSNKARLSPNVLLAIASLSGEALAQPSATVSGTEATPENIKAQQVYPAGSLSTFSGPEDKFTGQVEVRMAFPAEHTPYSGAYVTFQPGARTAWHSHPAGQHMVVIEGTAMTATRDGRVIEFQEGEAVWCPEGVDHWHGAKPHQKMTHFVVTNNKDGNNAQWESKVTDAQYDAAVNAIQSTQASFNLLSSTDQNLAVIVALASGGAIVDLTLALEQALDAGLPVNTLKEAFIHVYPYAGFPKSLNALTTLMTLVEERKQAGKKDIAGEEASALPEADKAQKLGAEVQTELVGHPVAGPLFDFAPITNTFLQKHLFGDVFARGLLSLKERELLTLALLANLPGTEPQLKSHVAIARNTGVTEAEMSELVELLRQRVGLKASQRLTVASND